jgi:hypothetical protein
MKGDDFLDSLDEDPFPEPNVEGDFDCHECRERIFVAFHDKNENILYWWCSKKHESRIKGFNV